MADEDGDAFPWNLVNENMRRQKQEPEKMYIVQDVLLDLRKINKLVVLPLSNGKPLMDPKACRPITLLPTLGIFPDG